MWRPTLVGRSNLFKVLRWQTSPTALPDIKGLFGALANRFRGLLVLRKEKAAVSMTTGPMPLSGIYLRGRWQGHGPRDMSISAQSEHFAVHVAVLSGLDLQPCEMRIPEPQIS
jgi:hypothetical protein